MTQQEFTQRTNVEVTYDEYAAIENVYMNSDLDKDEFCKMWCKMNQKRVREAIIKKEEEEMIRRFLWKLAQIANRDYTFEEYSKFADEVLNKKEQNLVKKAGIKFEEEVYNMAFNVWHIVPRSLSSVIAEVKEYIAA